MSMRKFEIKPELEKILVKLSKKDKQTYEKIMKKIEEILCSSDIEHYKNLKYGLKRLKRVHVGHFVLVFSYDNTTDFISFSDFQHHDVIYNRQ